MDKLNFSVRTDLAAESAETAFAGGIPDEDGISLESVTVSSLRCDRMTVSTSKGAERLGKPCGRYVTVTVPSLSTLEDSELLEIARVISGELSALLPSGRSCLVAALGNRSISADSQGPICADNLTVTRHLKENTPDIFYGLELFEAACIAPGVLGATGVEAADTVKGIVDRIKPDFVIAVDSLAARRTSRVGRTVQITDTGISPGSGIGNRRTALSAETLGVPVIAIGIPTVVDAVAVGYDVLEECLSRDGAPTLGKEERSAILQSVLSCGSFGYFVTPKDCDSLSARSGKLLASSINLTLNPSLMSEQ